MSLRQRLRADFDTSTYTGNSRVILEALKRYGMIAAHIGSDWFISGATDSRWNDTDLILIERVPGSAFEVGDTGSSSGEGAGGDRLLAIPRAGHSIVV